ncbi:outer membrane beta-barrel family protein [Robiginitalea aurantiaca]|uniref:Outer membrane beta-barrel family protein n=1 Tax=Robiginitalea aurantiaca TaxID=3056915 RepID=A0ABT7WAA4_9FLAO|nr:outer membrane beta-barrel family protein [Robiginitalea aurantiaca]MDM9629841.1 outer membrane beta-barrel family protein [Robiginitalea aurantiaca]
MKLKILLIVGLFPLLLTSQSFQISGSVKDTDGIGLPLANVLLLRASDSVQVKGTSADDLGRFTLKNIAPDLYFLKATYFGYQSVLVPLEVQGDIRIGALIMEEDGTELDEVVVTGQRPTVERLSDRVVFKVENTVISEGSTWDILRNAPGVIPVQDNLEIRGQSATVYINDRKVQLSQAEILDLLKGLDGNVISAVEVIPVPPASFEAADGPVLNIRTRQNIVPGYKGSVRAQYIQAVFPKYAFGTSHYYKSGKFGVFANYSISPRKEFRESENNINFIDDQNTVFSRWKTDTDRTSRTQAQQLNLILDYDISDRDQLNFTSNLTFSPNKTYGYQIETVMRNGQGVVDSTLNTLQDTKEDQVNTSYDLNYTRKLKKEGALLKANGHYTYYEEKSAQDGLTSYFDPAGVLLRDFLFNTDAKQNIDIFTGQADFYTPISSGSFEAGIKTSVIRSRNRIDYLVGEDNQRSFDIALSDRFNYDEEVYAAYASLNKTWDPWTMKVGLRAEQTEVEGRSLTLEEVNLQSYLEFFPSLYVSRDLTEDQSMAFSYSRRLTRPNYADLNPFRFFLNENDFVEGNPNLVPAFSHEFNLNWTLNDTFFVDLYYRDNGRYLSTISFQDNENLTLRQTKQNVESAVSYGLDFTISTSITPFWYLYSYNSVFYEDNTFFAEESDIETATNKVTGFYGYLNNSLTLSKDGSLTGEVSLLYLNRFLDGASVMSETITLNLGLRKTLWEDRAIISLTAEDLLGRANATFTTRYANQDHTYFARPETQFVRLGFTYKFGNFRLQNRDSDLDKDELQRIENE